MCIKIICSSFIFIFHHCTSSKDTLRSPTDKKYHNFSLKMFNESLRPFPNMVQRVNCRLSRTKQLADLEIVSEIH